LFPLPCVVCIDACSADLRREGGHFSRNPFNPSQIMTVDTLLEFIHFDGAGCAVVRRPIVRAADVPPVQGAPDAEEIHIQMVGDDFVFIEDGTFMVCCCVL
jgi:hypothetical protein